MAGSRTGAGGRGTGRAGGLRRCGEWCARHGVIVVVAWLVALIALQFADRSFGGDYSDNFTLPSSQSQQGLDVLERHDPAAGGYSAQIVVHDADQPLTSLGSQMSTTVADLQKLPHVLSVQNPAHRHPRLRLVGRTERGPPVHGRPYRLPHGPLRHPALSTG
jgi:RND superfamily putative drug exporter